MRARSFATGFLVATALALPALAQEQAGAQATFDSGQVSSTPAAGDDPTLPGALVLGGEVGAIFPQPFSELGTHVAFGVEVGYRLPAWEQRIEIFLAAAYSPPANTFTEDRDEGDYEGKVRQKMLFFSLGPRFRVMERSSPWNVTIALGPRLFLLQSKSQGDRNGEEFAEYKEQSTQFGFFLALGGEYNLGPGALFLDIDFGWSKLPHEITGDSSTGNITPTLGYRFFLL